MSSYAGPAAITDGLVFEYDMGNTQKSWKGAPITNLLTGTGTTNLGNGVFLSGGGTRTDLGNGKYRFDVTVARTFRMYCNLATLTNGQTYGCSLKFEENSCSFLSLDWCDTAVAGGVNSGAGITSGRLYGTATRGTYDATYRFLDINLGIGSVILSEAQVDSIPISTPYVNGTRSNTQAIVDLTGNNTVTANSLTYASDETFSFNGSADQISIPSINFSNEQTIEMWLQPLENDGSRRNPYNKAYGGYGTWTHETNGTINHFFGNAGANTSPYVASNSAFTVAQNEIACVCTTRNISCAWWYKNGIQYNSLVNPYGVLNTDNNSILIGNGYAGRYLGNIFAIRLYNRALSSAEISGNFNAYRGRFGI